MLKNEAVISRQKNKPADNDGGWKEMLNAHLKESFCFGYIDTISST